MARRKRKRPARVLGERPHMRAEIDRLAAAEGLTRIEREGVKLERVREEARLRREAEAAEEARKTAVTAEGRDELLAEYLKWRRRV